MMAKKTAPRKIRRSSVSGKFVKKSTVKRNPRTTTTETVRGPRRRPQSKKSKKSK